MKIIKLILTFVFKKNKTGWTPSDLALTKPPAKNKQWEGRNFVQELLKQKP
jgi:hypothetical protein